MNTVFNVWQSAAPCSAATIETFAMQALPIATANVVPPLSNAPLGDVFLLIVNGRTFTPVDPDAPFTLDGAAVNWTSAIYSLNPGDSVVAVYTFMGPL